MTERLRDGDRCIVSLSPFPSVSGLQRNETLVVLMIAFPGQKLVIAAAIFFGEGSARRRPTFIDHAVPFRRMQKLARAFENVIFTVPENTMAVAFDELGKSTLSLFVTQPETLCQSFYIAFCDQNPIISATIGRAL